MTANTYRDLQPLQVETKSAWGDSWTIRPNVEPINGSAAAGSVGQFQFRVRYGRVKFLGDSSFSDVAYTSIARDWIRVKRFPYDDTDILFMGRVESDSRDVFGPRSGVPTGIQVFTAYDGTQLLQKRMICQSVVEESTGVYKEHDILLHFNKHNFGRVFAGNRSATERTSGGFDHYVFKPTYGSQWTIADAIKYLIAEFMGGSGVSTTDPVWSVTIPSGQLTDVVEPMDMPSKISVLSAIQSLVGRQYGWTWCVLPNANGFELKFSTVTATAVTYEGVTVPANPDVLTVSTSDPDAKIQIEKTQVQSYGRVRVIGRPMVVVATFDEDNLDLSSVSEVGEIVQRKLKVKASPTLTGDHLPTVDEDGTLDKTTRGPLPGTSRNTLESIPLVFGHDYVTEDPPVEPDESLFRTPFIVSTLTSDPGDYVFYHEETQASIYTLPTDVGLVVKDFNEEAFTFGDYDHYITVAYEAAQRLQCVYEIAGVKDSDGEFVIEVPDAELWYLAKDTIIGIASDSTREIMAAGKELRNDRLKIYRVMAGCVARYINARSKANIVFKGLYPYNQSIGMILGTVTDSTDANTIAAPITGVQWQFEGDFSTTVTTGYAE